MGKSIFTKIIDREIPSEIIYEDDKVIAINDIDPKAPIHILIIPKNEIKSLNDLKDEDENLIGHIFIVARKIAIEKGISERGYRIVSNCGKEGGQSVDHIHFHLLGGRALNWPAG